jgi:hypothetical protein
MDQENDFIMAHFMCSLWIESPPIRGGARSPDQPEDVLRRYLRGQGRAILLHPPVCLKRIIASSEQNTYSCVINGNKLLVPSSKTGNQAPKAAPE